MIAGTSGMERIAGGVAGEIGGVGRAVNLEARRVVRSRFAVVHQPPEAIRRKGGRPLVQVTAPLAPGSQLRRGP